jgi:pimeloyl-ACP methyl ester carboxylesterase
MPVLAANGQMLAYEDTGGDLPVIALSHGLLMDRTMFAPQVHALSGDYRCISWDERGFGETGVATEPFTYWDSADDLVALLAALGAKRAVLAGMSQGGYLSLRAALRHPEAVKALILIDTQARAEDPETIPDNQALLEAWVAGGLTDEISAIIEARILGPGWPGAAEWRERWRALPRDGLPTTFQTLVGREDITDRLGEIEVPALVLHGDADEAIPLECARELADRLPDAELVVIPGAGHASNLTHPELVNPAIERFLARLGS